jgi:hypothetical protein
MITIPGLYSMERVSSMLLYTAIFAEPILPKTIATPVGSLTLLTGHAIMIVWRGFFIQQLKKIHPNILLPFPEVIVLRLLGEIVKLVVTKKK